MTRKLNAPREIPYAFRVVAFDEWVWLYDDSERSYICDTAPKVFMEPLYTLEGEDPRVYRDANYFHARSIEKLETFPVPLGDEDTAIDVPRKDAWDAAREEAQGNCLV